MADVGGISYVLEVDSKKFEAGFSKATATATNFANKITSVLEKGSLQGLANLAPGALGQSLSGVVTFFEDISQKARQARNEASSLGVSLKDLKAYKFLAKDDFDVFKTGAEHFQRTLADAASGSSEAQGKFQALGLDWKELSTATPAEAMGKWMDAVKGAGTHMDKLHIATTLGGRSAANMLPYLEQGSEGLEKFRAKAERSAEAIQTLDKFWQGFKDRHEEGMDQVRQGAADWIKLFTSDWNSDPRSKTTETFVPTPGEAKAKAQETVDNRLKPAIEALNIELDKQMNLLGKTADEAKVYALSLQGVSDAALKNSQVLAERNKAMGIQKNIQDAIDLHGAKGDHLQLEIDKLAKSNVPGAGAAAGILQSKKDQLDKLGLQDMADALSQSLENPLEQAKRAFLQGKKLNEGGFLSDEDLGRLATKQQDSLNLSGQGLGSSEKGSQQAISDIAAATREQQSGQVVVEDQMKQQTNIQQDLRKFLLDIRKAILDAQDKQQEENLD